MKCKILLTAIVICLLSISSLAAGKSSANVSMTSPSTVAGKQLGAGDYKVQWTGTGPNIPIEFILEGKVIATVPATVVEANNDGTSVQATTEGGVRTVSSIRTKRATFEFEKIGPAAGN